MAIVRDFLAGGIDPPADINQQTATSPVDPGMSEALRSLNQTLTGLKKELSDLTKTMVDSRTEASYSRFQEVSKSINDLRDTIKTLKSGSIDQNQLTQILSKLPGTIRPNVSQPTAPTSAPSGALGQVYPNFDQSFREFIHQIRQEFNQQRPVLRGDSYNENDRELRKQRDDINNKLNKLFETLNANSNDQKAAIEKLPKEFKERFEEFSRNQEGKQRAAPALEPGRESVRTATQTDPLKSQVTPDQLSNIIRDITKETREKIAESTQKVIGRSLEELSLRNDAKSQRAFRELSSVQEKLVSVINQTGADFRDLPKYTQTILTRTNESVDRHIQKLADEVKKALDEGRKPN